MIGGRHIATAAALAMGIAAIAVVPDQRAVGLAFLIVTGLEAGFFVVVYGLRSRWWGTILGRAMMAKAAAFLALVIWIVISWYAKDFPQRDAIRQFLYLAFAVTWLHMDISVWRVQQAGRRGVSADDEDAW